MSDYDVVVLCYHESFKQKIENQLRKKKYTVAEALIASRGKVLNDLSSINHARKKFVKLVYIFV